ncbi:MAG: TonB family protein, partial [Muribaculaceae bacterium]|nr:TonB family protein [Muribaculaceae bacterium]
AFGQKDNDKGTEDRNVTRTLKEEVVVEKKTPVEEKKEEIFKSVEQMPTFPGGDAALMKYLSSHINYPAMAQENGVQGRVVVQFVVTKTGKVGEVKVVRSVDKDLDREAVRVCKSLPNFVPGRQNGQPVNVWYTLPVTFKLQGTN